MSVIKADHCKNILGYSLLYLTTTNFDIPTETKQQIMYILYIIRDSRIIVFVSHITWW